MEQTDEAGCSDVSLQGYCHKQELLLQLRLNNKSLVVAEPGRQDAGQPCHGQSLLAELHLHSKSLISLRELYLNNNSLVTLPQTGFFDALPALRKLDVTWNQLKSIPAEIAQLKQLELLDLSFNPALTELPAEIGQLSQLQTLIATDCNLGGVPPELGALLCLRQCELQYNAIRQLPRGFLNMLCCEPSLTGNPLCSSGQHLEEQQELTQELTARSPAVEQHQELREAGSHLGALAATNDVAASRASAEEVKQMLQQLINDTKQVNIHREAANQQLAEQQRGRVRLQETLQQEGAQLHEKQMHAKQLVQQFQLEQALQDARARACLHQPVAQAAQVATPASAFTLITCALFCSLFFWLL